MIPYFDQPTLSLGPLTIHAFGVLVATAVLVGYRVCRRQVSRRGLDQLVADRLFSYIIVGGFVGAHLVDRLVYFPAETLQDPWSLVRFWDGLASFGGFLGAVTGAWLFTQRRRPPDLDPWPYLDSVAYAFPFGWIFGRLGCFLAYDHPGAPTAFVLGQRYRDGVVRHNLGLEEALFTVALAGLFWMLSRRPRAAGFYLGLLAMAYAPFRFALDFWRLVDVRYGGLTPGQWGCLALFLVGALIFRHSSRRPTPAAPTGDGGRRGAESEKSIAGA
jgi:phosphatidylglycerol---prolipoprotein diacylglyceryl transferase